MASGERRRRFHIRYFFDRIIIASQHSTHLVGVKCPIKVVNIVDHDILVGLFICHCIDVIDLASPLPVRTVHQCKDTATGPGEPL